MTLPISIQDLTLWKFWYGNLCIELRGCLRCVQELWTPELQLTLLEQILSVN